MVVMTIQTTTDSGSADATCACGQPLDCCHTAHCPRCGVTLRGVGRPH